MATLPSTVTRPSAPELDPRAIYLSPSGRCCRVCLSDSSRPTEIYATFIYHRKDGRPNTGVFAEGFVFSRANWHLLRRLAQMRPRGDITRAMATAWQQGPATVPAIAQRACVGLNAARYTASRMLQRGDVVVVHDGRPAVLGLPQAADPGLDSYMRVLDILDSSFWGGRR